MSNEIEIQFEQTQFKNSDAEKYGILEAIILWHLRRYLRWAKHNNKNLHEGRHWTYMSMKAWYLEIPFATVRQLETAMANLKKEGILLTGCFNKHKYDRTTWYSINDDAYIPRKCEMVIHEMRNGNPENVEPIPNPSTKTSPEVVEEPIGTTPTTTIFSNSLKDFKDYFGSIPFYSRLKAPGAIVLCHAYYQSINNLTNAYNDLLATYTKKKPYAEVNEEAWQKDCHSYIENAILKAIKK